MRLSLCLIMAGIRWGHGERQAIWRAIPKKSIRFSASTRGLSACQVRRRRFFKPLMVLLKGRTAARPNSRAPPLSYPSSRPPRLFAYNRSRPFRHGEFDRAAILANQPLHFIAATFPSLPQCVAVGRCARNRHQTGTRKQRDPGQVYSRSRNNSIVVGSRYRAVASPGDSRLVELGLKGEGGVRCEFSWPR